MEDFAEKGYLKNQEQIEPDGGLGKYLMVYTAAMVFAVSALLGYGSWKRGKEMVERVENAPLVERRLEKGENITKICREEIESAGFRHEYVPICRDFVCEINGISCGSKYTEDRRLPVGKRLLFPDLNGDKKIGH